MEEKRWVSNNGNVKKNFELQILCEYAISISTHRQKKMQWFRKWGNKGVKIKLNENVCMSDYTYKLT